MINSPREYTKQQGDYQDSSDYRSHIFYKRLDFSLCLQSSKLSIFTLAMMNKENLPADKTGLRLMSLS